MYLAKKLEETCFESVSNGDGFRLVIFTCGCIHHCEGCHNPETWNIENGVNYSVREIANYLINIYKESNGFFDGFTFSGGDPLYQQDELIELIDILKDELKDFEFDIWVYTGYRYEEIENRAILNRIDVLVDGKFEKDNRAYHKAYRGSNNQRVLVLEKGEIIEVK